MNASQVAYCTLRVRKLEHIRATSPVYRHSFGLGKNTGYPRWRLGLVLAAKVEKSERNGYWAGKMIIQSNEMLTESLLTDAIPFKA